MSIKLVKNSGNVNLTSPKIIGADVPIQEFYVGTEEPTDKHIRVWVNPDGQPTEGVATIAYVDEAIKSIDLSGLDIDLSAYALKSELDDFITEAQVDEKIEAIEIPEPDLSGYALKSEIPSLESYAKTEDIPDVSGYQTEEDVIALINANMPASGDEVSY